LACGEWVFKGESKELREETHLFLTVREISRYEL